MGNERPVDSSLVTSFQRCFQIIPKVAMYTGISNFFSAQPRWQILCPHYSAFPLLSISTTQHFHTTPRWRDCRWHLLLRHTVCHVTHVLFLPSQCLIWFWLVPPACNAATHQLHEGLPFPPFLQDSPIRCIRMDSLDKPVRCAVYSLIQSLHICGAVKGSK